MTGKQFLFTSPFSLAFLFSQGSLQRSKRYRRKKKGVWVPIIPTLSLLGQVTSLCCTMRNRAPRRARLTSNIRNDSDGKCRAELTRCLGRDRPRPK